MSIDFSVTTMSQMAGGATASAASSLATGSLMGNAAAQVEDPMSLLADAAEELIGEDYLPYPTYGKLLYGVNN